MDAITLEILRNQLEGIAEEMGSVLIRSAYSPNIKERQDCSTALFDPDGRLVAQAEHIPVHLGAMPDAVQAVLEADPAPGDIFILNDPYRGGTHLPDITLVSPCTANGTVVGYAVSRAHHADVGGMAPGSMPSNSRNIFQEGLRIPPVRLATDGEIRDDVLSLILANVRSPDNRRADLRAQMAAHQRAEMRLEELVDEHDRKTLSRAFDAVIDYARTRVRTTINELPDGTYEATDYLEGDGVTDNDIPIRVEIRIQDDHVTVDFDGSAAQLAGNLNAPFSVVKSSVYFVIRCVTDPEIPANYGAYEPVTIDAPQGSFLRPEPPAAVVGGNVETSQRIADVVFCALADAIPDQVPAQSQGTMNNLTIGSSQPDGFTYYETIAGGFGARPNKDGMDGVHVGMTNTLNTPIEALEIEYPFTVEKYALRPDSGGDGRFRGGLGLTRSIRVHTTCTVSILSERRRFRPQGLEGGRNGASGRNLIDEEEVPSKTTRTVPPGTVVSIRTPGGGGYGLPEERNSDARVADRRNGKVSKRPSAES